jgi:hypothetical protein
MGFPPLFQAGKPFCWPGRKEEKTSFMAGFADCLLDPFSIFMPLRIERTGIFLCLNAGD